MSLIIIDLTGKIGINMFSNEKLLIDKNNMSFKKNPTIEELKEEVESLQHQVVTLNANNNALRKQLNNHPAVIELSVLKSKWWVKLFHKG